MGNLPQTTKTAEGSWGKKKTQLPFILQQLCVHSVSFVPMRTAALEVRRKEIPYETSSRDKEFRVCTTGIVSCLFFCEPTY